MVSTPQGPADDLSTLSWVQEELRRSLEGVNKALKRHLKELDAGGDLDASDPAVLRQARHLLHQSVGALELVGLPQVARVLRAGEQALQRLAPRPQQITPAVVQQFEQACFGVVDLVARRLAGRPVSALALFPQYRVLQELAGQPRVHPVDLWELPWSWRLVQPPVQVALLAPDEAVVARFESDLLQLMRSGAPEVADRLCALCGGLAGTPAVRLSALWSLAAAFHESIGRGLLKLDMHSKRIGSRLLSVLRGGTAAEPPERLAHELLLQCSRADLRDRQGPGPWLQTVRQVWALPETATVDLEQARLGRVDPAVVQQARKRIGAAKDVWQAVAGGHVEQLSVLNEQFALICESIQRLFPDGGVLTRALQATAQQVVASGAAPSSELAMELATALLYVEAAVDDGDYGDAETTTRVQRLAERLEQVRGGRDPGVLELWMEELYRRVSDRQTMGSVVHELRETLSEIEQLIDQYFRDPVRRDLLIPVPAKLQAMRGVLSVLALDQASHAVMRMAEDVDGLTSTEVDPQLAIRAGTFDRLADNLGALSFMIDMVGFQPQMAKALFRFDAHDGVLRGTMARADRPTGFDELLDSVIVPAEITLQPLPVAPAQPPGARAAEAMAALRAAGGPDLPPLTGSETLPPTLTRALHGADFDAGDEGATQLLALHPLDGFAPPLSAPSGSAPFDALDPLETAPLPPPSPVQADGAEPTPEAAADAVPADPWSVPPISDPTPTLTLPGLAGALQAAAPTGVDGWPTLPAGGLLRLDDVPPLPVPPAPAPVAVPLDEDAEMREIFLEEARDVVRQAREALGLLAEQGDDHGALTAVRRAFHTLKGSSRMVGLERFGAAAWSCEQLYNARLAEHRPADVDLLGFTEEALDHLAGWVEDVAAQNDAGRSPDALSAAADALRLEGRRVPLAPQAAEPATATTPAALAPAVEPAAPVVDLADDATLVISGEQLARALGLAASDATAGAASDVPSLRPTEPSGPADVPADVDAHALGAAVERLLPATGEESGEEPSGFALTAMSDSRLGTEYATELQTELSTARVDLATTLEPPVDLLPRVTDAVADAPPALAPLTLPAVDATSGAWAEAAASALTAPLVDPVIGPVVADDAASATGTPLDTSADVPVDTATAGPAGHGWLDVEPSAGQPSAGAAVSLPPLADDAPTLSAAPGAGSVFVVDGAPPSDDGTWHAEVDGAVPRPDAPVSFAGEEPLDGPAEPTPVDADADAMDGAFDFAPTGLDAMTPPSWTGELSAAVPAPPAAAPLLALDGTLPLPEPLPAGELARVLDTEAVAAPGLDILVGSLTSADLPLPTPDVAELPAGTLAEAVVAGEALPPPPAEAPEEMRQIGPLRLSLTLFNIFIQEADDWSRRLSQELADWALQLHLPLGDTASALAHSLAGGSATVGHLGLSRLARGLEHALDRTQAREWSDEAEATLYLRSADEIRSVLHQFAAGFLQDPDEELVRALEAIVHAPPTRPTDAIAPEAFDEAVAGALDTAADAAATAAADLDPPTQDLEVPELAEEALQALEQVPPPADADAPAERPVLVAEHLADGGFDASAQRPDDAPVPQRSDDGACAVVEDVTDGVAEGVAPAAPPAAEPGAEDAVDVTVAVDAQPELLTGHWPDVDEPTLDPLASETSRFVAPEDSATGFDDDDGAGVSVLGDLDDGLIEQDHVDEELFPFFAEEGADQLSQLYSAVRGWALKPGDPAAASPCMRVLHTFKGGARLAGAMRLGEMAHRLESAVTHLATKPHLQTWRIEQLQGQIDALQTHFDLLRQQVEEHGANGPVAPVRAPMALPAWPAADELDLSPRADAGAVDAASSPAAGGAAGDAASVARLTPSGEAGEAGADAGVLPQAEPVGAWSAVSPADASDADPTDAWAPFETGRPSPDPSSAFVDAPSGLADAVADGVADVPDADADAAPQGLALGALAAVAGLALPAAADLDLTPAAGPLDLELPTVVPDPVMVAQALGSGPSGEGAAADAAAASGPQAGPPDVFVAEPPTSVPEAGREPAPEPPPAEPPAIDWQRFAGAQPAPELEPEAVAPAAQQRQSAVATVRVRAQLLDRLVNQAGEVSIARARIEANVLALKSAFGDLSDNLERLRSQLRDIELQAELQINTRMEAARSAQEQFDPLEMDRFTRFQELTRMMAESVSDVATVQRGLTRAVQSAEDALAHQSRMTHDMQDELLRTRMVEFEALSERLSRVVRQAARESGRQVRLDIVGGAIEIDRGVLDRMTPAFEHLLRNAVVHGIESPEQRQGAGKDATGLITLGVSQQGNEVVVEVADDGAGLNLARIHERALAQGLVKPGEHPGESDLAQMVFMPGFTTATEVTDLAGRGVGMDVVRTEVSAMGGRIETRTQAGQGTAFRLVLPLTTAVTQVVMMRCGERAVAVPSTLIETLRRVSADELAEAYARGSFLHNGESLPFHWLDALLEGTPCGHPVQGHAMLAVIRSAAQRVVLHVDEVTGNQEVVVKNLGPQLSRLPGLVGMTLLPSGLPSLIYNPLALTTLYGTAARERTRQAWSGQARPELLPRAEPVDGMLTPLVMVVDDSLTVRRVTQRLLEREGYRVRLAKDGLDALELLGGELPAVVLTDIEMPRMDGFDLVRNMKVDPRLATLPLIMITSRIAQKHRDYAAELGVAHYLGKPYAEEELLALVAHHARVGVPA